MARRVRQCPLKVKRQGACSEAGDTAPDLSICLALGKKAAASPPCVSLLPLACHRNVLNLYMYSQVTVRLMTRGPPLNIDMDDSLLRGDDSRVIIQHRSDDLPRIRLTNSSVRSPTSYLTITLCVLVPPQGPDCSLSPPHGHGKGPTRAAIGARLQLIAALSEDQKVGPVW